MSRNGWEAAKATVTARRESGKMAISTAGSGPGGLGRKRYEYVVDVSPNDGQAPFTTTMITPLFVDHWRPLREGDVATILHKPGTEEVKWDKSEPSTDRKAELRAYEEASKRSNDEAFEEALHAGPGHRRGDAEERD